METEKKIYFDFGFGFGFQLFWFWFWSCFGFIFILVLLWFRFQSLFYLILVLFRFLFILVLLWFLVLVVTLLGFGFGGYQVLTHTSYLGVPGNHLYLLPGGTRYSPIPLTWGYQVLTHTSYLHWHYLSGQTLTRYVVLPCTGYICSVHETYHQVITYAVAGL